MFVICCCLLNKHLFYISLNMINTTTKITSTMIGVTFKIIGSHNCQSTYVIHVIICKRLKQYVGQTSTNLNTRLRTHISDIKPVPEHFKNGTRDVTVSIIDRYMSHNVRREHGYVIYVQSNHGV